MAPNALSTRAQQSFFGIAVFQAFVVIAMVAVTFNKVEDHVDLTLARYKTIPCYLALFILAEFFELFMAFDALRLRNTIQLLGILIFHGALIVMSALQVHETRSALVTNPAANWTTDYVNGGGPGTLWQSVLPFLIVTPVVIGVSWLAMMWVVRELYYEFGWAIFHIVGANPAAKTMYQYYQIMICLLKFDFFAFVGVTMQLLILVLQTNSAEFGLTVAAIPIVLVLLVGAGLAVQREIKWLMSISLVLMLAAETYFYKLVRFYEPSSSTTYGNVRATLTTFTIIAFLLLFATFAIGLRCFADFDKGLLKSKLHGQSYKQMDSSSKMGLFGGKKEDGYGAGQPLGPRVSIE
ncbi:uncharacterized protein BXZ73DRAFT_95667 [Epithele typhae]|uniref:uncharacterized protein n=1 Tax=Epithele typhae TaxID=378194 RepID=UPI002007EAB5|nr:uncharacterized protein BXZ73DRAFT_95667 [Epithele typhae]KAH9946168.1 hypothetical protein BXZ73DRAFT_95667 [Epithele typhae]